ncbi:MAG: putative Zinc/iron permease [Candidatus Saccharibacteria bacterium]|nr:putative Zinc/iron permease [Candidatus Saccharibacteria bacterium]
MATYWHVIFFSLIGGVFSLIGGALLLSRRKTATALAEYATPLAAGALIAAVFLDLLKDGLEEAEPSVVLVGALAGIVLFFYAERFLHWFHHHHEHENTDPAKNLIIIGDTMHNALDGVAIAAAFLVSVPTGIITTIAVAAHEIPQEIGDFGLLLSKGMSRGKVLLVNALSAVATTVMAVITFALGSADKLPIGLLLGLSAGFLLYIALSDIIPTIHDNAPKHRLFDIRPILLLVGVLVVGVSVQLAHKYIDVGHDNHVHTSAHCESVLHAANEGPDAALRGMTAEEAKCLDAF